MQKILSILIFIFAASTACLPALAQSAAAGAEASGAITGQAESGQSPAAEQPAAATEPAVAAEPSVAAETPAAMQDDAYQWKTGPQAIALLDQGRIALPVGYAFLDSAQAQQMLRKFGNPNVDDVAGVVTGPGKDWLLVIRVGKVGFVKDGDASNWDVDALIAAIRQGTEQTNALRGKDGAEEIEVLGWIEAPKYDASLYRVTSAIATRNKGDASDDAQAVNYNTFALGRDGYVSLNLISGLTQLDRNRPHADAIIAAFEFDEGKRYVDFNPADPVAQFGLSGLVSNAVATAKQEPAAAKRSAPRVAAVWVILGVLLAVLVLGALAWFFLFKEDNAVPQLIAADAAEGGEQAAAKH